MKTICKMQGGSHSYGLNTPASDIDIRGVFLNDEINTLVGIDRFEHLENRENEADDFLFELRRFLCLLRKGNTQALEMLFNDTWIAIDYEFSQVIAQRHNLIDPVRLFSCLQGYMHSERRLANGERTGQLGSKRKAQLDKYGFSPKNFVQLFRLSYCGSTFFSTGEFPVNVVKHNAEFGAKLMAIKTQPELFKKEELNELVDKHLAGLTFVFETNKSEICSKFKFDQAVANELLLELYGPIIYDQYQALAQRRLQAASIPQR